MSFGLEFEPNLKSLNSSFKCPLDSDLRMLIISQKKLRKFLNCNLRVMQLLKINTKIFLLMTLNF
jgi:hypothetical protein